MNTSPFRFAVGITCLMLLGSCTSSPTAPDDEPTETTERADDVDEPAETDAPSLGVETDDSDGPRFGSFGFDTDGMDTDVAPGDDFYGYANGTWDSTTEIPSDRSRFGAFDALRLDVEEQLHQLITGIDGNDVEPETDPQRIADLYQSWMDVETIDDSGLAPATPYLERIDAIDDRDGAARLMAELAFPSMIRIGIMPDPADPSVYAISTGQSGLGLPDRDYYLDDSEQFEHYRGAYRDYIIEIHELAGLDDAEAKADAIIELETQLAEAHWTRERSREIQETYNVKTVEEFADLAPSLRLRDALDIRELRDLDELIVSQPSAIEATGQIFEDTDLETLQNYLTFHFISDRASWLPSEFDDARFDFYSRTLSGTEEQRERHLRGTQIVSRNLGHAVGQQYVDRHFPPQSRDQMNELVDNLLVGFDRRLSQLEWMDEQTRDEALDKLSTFEPRIGYPEIWDNFDGLQIDDDDYFGNRMRVSEYEWQRDLDRFGEPVDRRRWSWPPQTVNAGYHPMLNQITFPAGILQPPFFDADADAAVNYGAIGGVIGHEIGHGFDDQGRRFDSEGRIRDWWTEETDEAFEEASGRLVEQYSQFCPLEDECINGRLALGENIGDLGGLQMAYIAYRNHVQETYPDGEAPVIDGFTGDQRFFLAWAQLWRSLYREDAMRSQLVRGPHSPGMYRVNGVVRNLDAWYDAFDIDEDHELYLPPEERVSIW